VLLILPWGAATTLRKEVAGRETPLKRWRSGGEGSILLGALPRVDNLFVD
jgi:hypothetical protein